MTFIMRGKEFSYLSTHVRICNLDVFVCAVFPSQGSTMCANTDASNLNEVT